MSWTRLKPGDWVIYRKQKLSDSPGPRAKHVVATPAGEDYRYTVEKFWIVEQIRDDGTVVLRTRRGKKHEILQNESRLRKARWWERVIYWNRFRAVETGRE